MNERVKIYERPDELTAYQELKHYKEYQRIVRVVIGSDTVSGPISLLSF